ncbi:MAG: hypothetical protein IH861_12530, partial [Chloroflexi bacterium]|nr:hypothetical protein [Chloroflexota bacterium]
MDALVVIVSVSLSSTGPDGASRREETTMYSMTTMFLFIAILMVACSGGDSKPSFSDGIHVVGIDVSPGTYQRVGTESFCYWARLSGPNVTNTIPSGENIIVNGASFSDRITVTISPTDHTFESSKCGGWRRIGSPIQASTSQSRYGLNWGQFASHPVKPLLEVAPPLDYTDAKILALDMLGANFDQIADLGYFNLLGNWFSSYKRANEFERRKIKPELRDRYNARLNELKSAEYLLDIYKHISLGGDMALGEYSFEEKAFPLKNVSAVSSVVRASNYVNARDPAFFPRQINMEERRAARLVAEAANRKDGRNVTLYILFESVTASGYV